MNESRGVEDMGRYLIYATASDSADSIRRAQGRQAWVQLDPDDQYGLPWHVCAAALEEGVMNCADFIAYPFRAQ